MNCASSLSAAILKVSITRDMKHEDNGPTPHPAHWGEGRKDELVLGG